LFLSLSRGMNGLTSDADEMAIRRMRTGWHDDDARALRSRRILTQNRYPLLLKAHSIAEFYERYEA
jgi:hypothetical protein